MKFGSCRTGESTGAVADVTPGRTRTSVVSKDVPARVCEHCAEYYLSSGSSVQVLARAETAVQNNAGTEILPFVA